MGLNADLNSGLEEDFHEVVVIGLPAIGGHVIGGTQPHPIRVDPTGTTVQPVSIVGGGLGAGISTEAKQDDIINLLSSINSNLSSCNDCYAESIILS